jgi:hypothetical protein
MLEDIAAIAENVEFLNANQSQPNVEAFYSLPCYADLADLEVCFYTHTRLIMCVIVLICFDCLQTKLKASEDITFQRVFVEPTGYYLLKCFLISEYSVDKIVFLNDLNVYRKMTNETGRLRVL